MRHVWVPIILLLAACSSQVTPQQEANVGPSNVYAPQPVVSVNIEPPVVDTQQEQPQPIAVSWAPPAMLVEPPPPQPDPASVWVGGYWVWQGNWVWAHGHWAPPPRPHYRWVHPYYENRHGVVLFITGHWAAPGVVFRPPGMGIHFRIEPPGPGVTPGPRPLGPDGCFVPPPPGSRPGIIIPAPIGTAPAVVTGAPPVRAAGMRILYNGGTNLTAGTHVTIIAPASATISGEAVNRSVPAQAHLAAMLTPVVQAQAPAPRLTRAFPSFVPGGRAIALPPPQAVRVANLPRSRPSAGSLAMLRSQPSAGAEELKPHAGMPRSGGTVVPTMYRLHAGGEPVTMESARSHGTALPVMEQLRNPGMAVPLRARSHSHGTAAVVGGHLHSGGTAAPAVRRSHSHAAPEGPSTSHYPRWEGEG